MRYYIIYDEIDVINQICFQCNGYLFGGYVRDVIIPSKMNQFYKYGGVDYWFKKPQDIKRFLSLTKDLIRLKSDKIETRESYIPIKIFLSNELPTEDVNVNACYYDGNSIFIPDETTPEIFCLGIEKRKCYLSKKYLLYKNKKKYKEDDFFIIHRISGYPVITKILSNTKKRIKYMKKLGWDVFEPQNSSNEIVKDTLEKSESISLIDESNQSIGNNL